MSEYTDIIKEASKIVREVAEENFTSIHKKNIFQKKDGSFVTNFDTQIDEALANKLQKEFPQIGFISEESQSDEAITPGLVWCIDPIDGTHNFMMDVPYYAVSVGLLLDGNPVAGIIYNPISKNLLLGGRGNFLELNGEKFSVKNNSFIVTTNRSHADLNKEREKEYISEILKNYDFKYRRFGSCALDLMNLVLGRIGAVYMIGNNKWDWAAGYAIAQAAQMEIVHDEDIIRINSKQLSDSLFMIK